LSQFYLKFFRVGRYDFCFKQKLIIE